MVTVILCVCIWQSGLILVNCDADIFVTILVGEWVRPCTPTQARQVDAMPKVAGSNPTRDRVVSEYLLTTLVYLSKRFHSMCFLLHFNV